MIQIIALKTFDRAVKKLMSKADIEALASLLRHNPEEGVVVKGSGGIRKMRWAADKGKSGGLRIIYFYQDNRGRIFLITAYSKNQKKDLTDAEVNALKKLTSQLNGEE